MPKESPFPGMDPYLEKHWGDVRHSLIVYGADQLQEQLPDSLRARMNERVFCERDGDDSMTEAYIEILDPSAANPVVTVIEILTAANKAGGVGTREYIKMQQDAAASGERQRKPY